ncbi:xanthine dehydrogenase family protein subunit M [Mesorhizobium sp. VK4C]|uniref:FAD binding domain-containing protein n=1 Tax=Mesorhizobium captivum TaxID=3072319 RepID=UPI002A245A21|nr:xanthine dehydrogenase family protein subunit M [Mesorhizobium sp. VK4C]MDX8501778.1 xanthine dehydrogenase family protein subunit M [Mesorhizobium sp. VK4C]
MKAFEYHRPHTVSEAVELLSSHQYEARILAGGQSLLNMMKWRLAAPSVLVDANRVAELSSIRKEDSAVRIGAMVRYRDLPSGVPEACGAIHDAVSVIADFQVRNLGTLGGSCCQADPFGDMPNVVVALGAEMTARSVRGERQISVDDFFLGPLQTALEPDEMLCAIRLPLGSARTGSAYEKFSWREGDFAIVSVAAAIGLDSAGSAVSGRIVVGGLGVGPVRLGRTEEVILGADKGADVIKAAADQASREVDPEDDRIYGSARYKRELVRTLTAKALARAWNRAENHKGSATR